MNKVQDHNGQELKVGDEALLRVRVTAIHGDNHCAVEPIYPNAGPNALRNIPAVNSEQLEAATTGRTAAAGRS